MSDERRVPEPTELVYPPRSSWLPLLIAAGIAALGVSIFKGWPYAVAGAIIFLIALRRWVVETRDDVDRLPRRQRLTTAVIPAEPLRRPGTDS
jgi:hypothetical protein